MNGNTDLKQFRDKVQSVKTSLEQYSPDHTTASTSKIPRYLIDFHQHFVRKTVFRALERLVTFMDDEKLNEEVFNKLEYNDLEIILCSILYAEGKVEVGWEWKAGEYSLLYERIHEDCDRLDWKEIKEDQVKITSKIISLHKIATYLVSKRFSEQLYNRLKSLFPNGTASDEFDRFKKLLGIVAACGYDSINEHPDKFQIKKGKDIIEKWCGINCKIEEFLNKETVNYVVLYDLPICKIENKDGGSRGIFIETALNNFIKFITEELTESVEEKSQLCFVTFHYEQARFFSGFENKEKSLNIIKQDLLKGKFKVGDENKYELENVTTIPTNGILENNGYAKVWEFRFIKNDLLNLLLSKGSEIELKPYFYWPRAILKLLVYGEKGEEKNPKSEWMTFFPRFDYFPLPLFDAICHMAKTYEKAENCYQVHVEFREMLDTEFPKRRTFYLPVFNESVDDHDWLTALYVNAIGAHIVNTGVLAGFESVRVWGVELTDGKSGSSQVVKTSKELAGKVNELIYKNKLSGFEILVHNYIEPFIRSVDVVVSNDKEDLYSKQYVEKIFGDPRVLSRKIKGEKEKTYSIGIDIGATAIKCRLYNKGSLFESPGENTESSVQEVRRATVKKPANPAEKYKTLEEFMTELYVLCKKVVEINDLSLDGKDNKLYGKGKFNKEKWNRINFIGITWPGSVRDGKIAGTSGIFKNFEEAIASHWMRKMTVDKLRELNPTEEMRKVLRNKLFEEFDKANIKKELEKFEKTATTIIRTQKTRELAKEERKTELQNEFYNVQNEENCKLIPEVGFVNDGTAEALARITLGRSYFRRHRWSVLKLGTGTAGMMIDNGQLRNGLLEYGKLINNIYVGKNGKPSVDDFNKTMAGVNEEASKNLLPNVFNAYVYYVKTGVFNKMLPSPPDLNSDERNKLIQKIFKKELPEDFKLDAYDVDRIADFFLKYENESEKHITELVTDLGIFKVHLDEISTRYPRDKFEMLILKGRIKKQINLLKRQISLNPNPEEINLKIKEISELENKLSEVNPDLKKLKNEVKSQLINERKIDHPFSDYSDEEREMLNMIGRTDSQMAFEYCFDKGLWRLKEIIRALDQEYLIAEINDEKGHIGWVSEYIDNTKKFEARLGDFKEILKMAGQHIAEVIMLIRNYYQNDGVIFSGGVLANTLSNSFMMDAVEEHLKQRYHVKLETLATYKKDKQNKLVGKRSYTTIYTNLEKDEKNRWIVYTKDAGEKGGIIMAAMKKYLPDIQREVYVSLELDDQKKLNPNGGKANKLIGFIQRDGEKKGNVKIKNFWKSDQVNRNDYIGVVLMAIIINIDSNNGDNRKILLLFKRAEGYTREGELLYLSGRIEDKDFITQGKDINSIVGKPITEDDIVETIRREVGERIGVEKVESIDINDKKVYFQKREKLDSKTGFAFFLAKVHINEPEKREDGKYKFDLDEAIEEYIEISYNTDFGKNIETIKKNVDKKDEGFNKMTEWLMAKL